MKNTKIICTLGPASDNYETLKKMVEAGMNVARINMSHGSIPEQQEKVDIIKKLRDDLNIPLAIMIDTKGPEVRIKTFKDGKINLEKGDTFTFTTEDIIGDETKVAVTYSNLHKDIKVGNTILVSDGLIAFTVKEVKGNNIICTCENAGALSDRKGMNFPEIDLTMPFLSEADKKDLDFAISIDAEFIAASFVSTAINIIELKAYLESKGMTTAHIIAKIENHSGIENIDEIIEVSEAVMVARGDMGVEIDYYKLPRIQKSIIKKVTAKGKQVIIATEMLESMINNPRATRAEVSDVANAVYDETCAVMLSGETAMGKNPIKAVQVMANIAIHVEQNLKYEKRFGKRYEKTDSITDTISHSACNTALQLNAKAIIVATESGKTARMVSKFRPNTPILTFISNKKAYNQLSLVWGVYAINTPCAKDIKALLAMAQQKVSALSNVKKGDIFVVTAGLPLGEKGSTNLIQVEKVL